MVLKRKGPGEERVLVELHSVQNSPDLFSVTLSLVMVVKVYQVLLVTQETSAIPR